MRLPTPLSGRTGRQLRRLLEALRIQLIRITTENVGLKVMSLGLAVSIWTLLQAEQVVEQRTRVHRARTTGPKIWFGSTRCRAGCRSP